MSEAAPAPSEHDSGGRHTAIACGVLATLIGLWHGAGVVGGIANVAGGHSTFAETLIGLGLNLVVACLSLAGGVLVLRRRLAGRVAVVAGAALAAAMYLLLTVLGPDTGAANPGGALALVIVGVPALAAIVLALVPPTARWLATGRARYG